MTHFIFSPLRNLHGKRPADYAASLEMLEIFQKASEGNQDANTSLSPSSLSVVRVPEDDLLHSMSPASVELRSLISDVLVSCLR